jgi:hypothetical protein
MQSVFKHCLEISIRKSLNPKKLFVFHRSMFICTDMIKIFFFLVRGVDNLLSHRACVQKRHRRSANAERQLDDLPEGETQLLSAWPVSVLLQRDSGFQLRRVQGIGLCYVHHARVSAATECVSYQSHKCQQMQRNLGNDEVINMLSLVLSSLPFWGHFLGCKL